MDKQQRQLTHMGRVCERQSRAVCVTKHKCARCTYCATDFQCTVVGGPRGVKESGTYYAS